MKKLFLLLVMCFSLSACSLVTMERQIYPICMSIDQVDSGEYLLGLQAPRASNSEPAEYDIISASGATLQDALRTLSASTPYPLNFSQIRLCIIGQGLASDAPLRPLLRLLMEQPTMRPTACVSIALGSAMEVLQNQKPDFGNRLSTHLNLLFERMQQEHLLPESTLAWCVRELSDDRCDLLISLCAVNEKNKQPSEQSGQKEEASPAVALGEPWSEELLPRDIIAGKIDHTSPNPVEFLGAACVSRGKVVGILTADETQLCLQLADDAKLQVVTDGDRMQLQFILKKESPLARDAGRILQLMQKLQSLQSDPLLFGGVCAMHFSTNEAWRAFDFRSRYPHAEVAVKVK